MNKLICLYVTDGLSSKNLILLNENEKKGKKTNITLSLVKYFSTEK